MGKTGIEWTDISWNPIRGCSPVSAGCKNCWAVRMANRKRGGAYKGFVEQGRWTGRVELISDQLEKPLHWRNPRKIATCLMGDLFHEALSLEDIARVLDVTRRASWHTYQFLTKRPQRMRDAVFAMEDAIKPQDRPAWPRPNVWLGVSVEDQASADERIPLLLQTPAAVRWVSYEPALGPVDFRDALNGYPQQVSSRQYVTHDMALDACAPEMEGSLYSDDEWEQTAPPLDWLVIGGESGPGARPCDVEWIRSAMQQCQAASVPVFVKQLSKRPLAQKGVDYDTFEDPRFFEGRGIEGHGGPVGPDGRFYFTHPKGGDPAEWPEDLRVREFPT